MSPRYLLYYNHKIFMDQVYFEYVFHTTNNVHIKWCENRLQGLIIVICLLQAEIIGRYHFIKLILSETVSHSL